METETVTDPFGTPAAIPTEFPTVASFRGRLVLIKPVKQETVPNNLGKPGDMQERITANVTVVDGQGPVPGFTRNQHTGQFFEGPEFLGMWISQEIIVKQLADALRTGGMVLARIDTRTPGTIAAKGNPWGLIEATDADKQMARNFLANRAVSGAQAPAAAPQPQAAPAPVAAQPQAQPVVTAAPVFQAAPAPVQAQPVASAPPNPAAGNPFA